MRILRNEVRSAVLCESRRAAWFYQVLLLLCPSHSVTHLLRRIVEPARRTIRALSQKRTASGSTVFWGTTTES